MELDEGLPAVEVGTSAEATTLVRMVPVALAIYIPIQNGGRNNYGVVQLLFSDQKKKDLFSPCLNLMILTRYVGKQQKLQWDTWMCQD